MSNNIQEKSQTHSKQKSHLLGTELAQSWEKKAKFWDRPRSTGFLEFRRNSEDKEARRCLFPFNFSGFHDIEFDFEDVDCDEETGDNFANIIGDLASFWKIKENSLKLSEIFGRYENYRNIKNFENWSDN